MTKQLPYFTDKLPMKRQKRFEVRNLCADLIKVAWTPEIEQQYIGWAILEDISPSGACLKMDAPIPVAYTVELELGDERFRAAVRYCNYDEVNYMLGVEFKSGHRWSGRRWKPKHLIEVCPYRNIFNLLSQIYDIKNINIDSRLHNLLKSR